MTTRYRELLGALVALAVAACGREAENTAVAEEQPAGPAAAVAAPAPVVAAPAGPVLPRPTSEPFQTTDFRAGAGAEGREIGGTLEAFPSQPGEPDGVYLYARVTGLTPGPHAWHIHAGPCSEVGRIIVPFTATEDTAGIAGPLVADSSGAAEQTVYVPLNLLSRQRMEVRAYSVRVHVGSGIDFGPSRACARL